MASVLRYFSVRVISGCSVEMAVAFSVEKEEDAELVDIVTVADSFSGSSVLNIDDDVTVPVSCVYTSDGWTPEISSWVDDESELTSGGTESVFDWLVARLC